MNLNKYYQLPVAVINNDRDMHFAFTMRMLNFLFRMKVRKHWDYLTPVDVELYAWRMDERAFQKSSCSNSESPHDGGRS